MVEHSPSPESRGPIQEWEVQNIADVVEEWYAKGAPNPPKHENSSQQTRTTEPRPSLSSIAPNQHEYDRPIQKEDVKPLVDAAEHLIDDEDKLEEKIRALRIEEVIFKYAPEFADPLRYDERPHWITAEQYRLLPHDAPEQMQRRYAILAHRNLGHRLQKARESGTSLTKDDVLGYYHQFRGQQQPNSGHDFTLENLLAVAQRKELLGYKMRDQGERMEGLYQDSIALQNLIQEAVDWRSVQPIQTGSAESPTATSDGASPNVDG
jgi:hypothetical protein